MPCCRCNRTGSCKGCACVKAGIPCTNCLPSKLGSCVNTLTTARAFNSRQPSLLQLMPLYLLARQHLTLTLPLPPSLSQPQLRRQSPAPVPILPKIPTNLQTQRVTPAHNCHLLNQSVCRYLHGGIIVPPTFLTLWRLLILK
jgi:hypothetical protein